MKIRHTLLLAVVICMISALWSFGQSPAVGVGAKISTLGIGFEGAVRATDRSNIRAGFNFFNYSRTYDKRGIRYDGDVDLRSFQVTYDQYLFGGFHISPSLLAYNGNAIDASAAVPAGESFTLGGTTYFSALSNPVGGTGAVTLRKLAPAILFGSGNLIPHSGRHLGFNVEGGVVFQGSPNTKLNLTGSACLVNPSTGCLNAATDPIVQRSIQAEQSKINSDLEPLKYFPVLSFGISWKL